MKKNSVLLFVVLCILTGGCDKEPGSDTKTGTFQDLRDSRTYKWVKIGEQTWMAENLAYLPSVSPSPDWSYTDLYYHVYGYEGNIVSEAKAKQNYITYGTLYNWEAARTACPVGWHLSSDEEWKVLETRMGMIQVSLDISGWRDPDSVGYKLKSKTGWEINGNGVDSVGFSALPGGAKNGIGGFGLGRSANFWTSTVKEVGSDAWYRALGSNICGIYRGESYFVGGCSVRCIKD